MKTVNQSQCVMVRYMLAIIMCLCSFSSAFAMSESVTINEGETKTLYLPSSFTNMYPYCKSTTWMSYGTEYVDITSQTQFSVTIKGKKAFSSPIVVRCNYYYYLLSGGKYVYGGTTYYDFQVTVAGGQTTVKPTSISFSSSVVGIDVGESRQLTPTVYPSNAEYSLTWSISDTSVATISQSGLLTGKSAGAADLKVKADNGVYAMLRVVVSDVKPSSVSVSPTSVDLQENGYKYLSATVYPSSASQSVTWSSSNSNVATVNSSGKVTAVKAGTCVITASTSNGKTGTCSVTVMYSTVYVTSISLNTTNSTLNIGETLQLSASVSPSNATNRSVSWTSSDTDVATVNSSGLVTGIATGSATIKCTAADGSGRYATCNVTVNKKVEEDVTDSGSTSASNDLLQIADITSKSGGTAILPISLTNEEVISGFQFSLSLPEGVSVTDAEMSDRASKLTPSYNLSNGLYKFSVMSLNGKTVSGNDGVVMNIQLQLASTIKEGTYAMTLKDVKLFTEDGNEIAVADNSAKLTVKNYMLGDVNNNGEVNTNDAIAIVNHVIGESQSVFVEDAADVNGNGEINTNDAIAIVNYVIGKTSALKAKSRQSVEDAKTDNAITLDNVSASAGENATLHVKMKNDFVASGYQFHLSLPEGVTIDCDDENWDTTDRTKKFAVSGNYSDGVYKFSVMSLTGKTITGNEGDVLTINLKVDASVLPNDYPMTITNAILFEDGSTKDHRIADSSAILSIKSNDTPTIGDFSWVGSYTVTATVEVENGNSNEYPVTFNMEICEDADSGLKISKFLLTDFIYDITGGLWLTDMEAASGKIQVKDDLLGFAEGDADIMYQIKSYNNVEWLEYDWIGLHAVNENDIHIDDFIVERVLIDYYSDDIFSAPKVGARYSNVIAHKTGQAASLHSVNTAEARLDMSIDGNSIHFGHKVPVKVFGMNGTLVRNTVTDHVDALAKGLYIVKVGGYTRKVLIK